MGRWRLGTSIWVRAGDGDLGVALIKWAVSWWNWTWNCKMSIFNMLGPHVAAVFLISFSKVKNMGLNPHPTLKKEMR